MVDLDLRGLHALLGLPEPEEAAPPVDSKVSQADAAARLATLGEGRPSKTPPIGGVSAEQAADLFNVGKRSVERACEVRDRGERPPGGRPCAESEAPVSAPARPRKCAQAASSVRQQRYRQRQRTGSLIVSIEITEELVEAMVVHGFVDAAVMDDREAVRSGLQRLHATLLHEST